MEWTGAEIRRRREAKGWTQQQLADALGASRRAVVSWEQETSTPQGRFIGKLDRILGGPAEETDEGPLLRDATFAELLTRLMTLYNAAVRDSAALPPGLSLEEDALPPDLRNHRVIRGPRSSDRGEQAT